MGSLTFRTGDKFRGNRVRRQRYHSLTRFHRSRIRQYYDNWSSCWWTNWCSSFCRFVLDWKMYRLARIQYIQFNQSQRINWKIRYQQFYNARRKTQRHYHIQTDIQLQICPYKKEQVFLLEDSDIKQSLAHESLYALAATAFDIRVLPDPVIAIIKHSLELASIQVKEEDKKKSPPHKENRFKSDTCTRRQSGRKNPSNTTWSAITTHFSHLKIEEGYFRLLKHLSTGVEDDHPIPIYIFLEANSEVSACLHWVIESLAYWILKYNLTLKIQEKEEWSVLMADYGNIKSLYSLKGWEQTAKRYTDSDDNMMIILNKVDLANRTNIAHVRIFAF
eukprot:TRINITY_DN100_c1_g1_i1.p2 TRINITY_DN100_c1_g1~~TRINITY_DN100_c1_g1_i1.p2  ORF type:complete len:333 (-),score=-5.04 TRINITY_DN100_c1_g1_i1:834-1832(-)